MSDINPINTQSLFKQTSLSALTTSTLESLSALSSVDNSTQQLASSSWMEQPPLSPELVLHLHSVSDIAGAAPEAGSDRELILPPAADYWPEGMPANQRGNRGWITTDALPFFAAEEINDEKSDAGITFMHRVVIRMPHVAEKIYQETTERLKKDLQAFIGGNSGISREAAEQAWQHFQVELSAPKCRALGHIIRTSKTLTAADQHRFLERLHDAQAHHVASHQNDAARSMSGGKIQLSDLPAGSLSPDTMEILARFGTTAMALQQFRSDAAAVKSIREMLKNNRWHEMEINVSQMRHHDAKLREEPISLSEIIGKLNETIDIVQDFILYDFELLGISKYEIDTKTGSRINRLESIYEKFNDDFLNSFSRYRLYQTVCHHNTHLMSYSLVNPRKTDLLSYRDNLQKLTDVFNQDYAQRSRLLNHMVIAPLVFDISGASSLPTRTAPPYGDRYLPFHFFDNLIKNPAVSAERLKYILTYCNLRLIEITNTGNVDLSWFTLVTDKTLQLIFSFRDDDSSFFDFGKNYRHPELKLLGAIKEIGKVINITYDDNKLPELLEWIKERLAFQGSYNDLAYALFTDAPGYRLSLCNIAVRIKSARQTGNSDNYRKEDVIRDFTHFCHKVIEREQH